VLGLALLAVTEHSDDVSDGSADDTFGQERRFAWPWSSKVCSGGSWEFGVTAAGLRAEVPALILWTAPDPQM